MAKIYETIEDAHRDDLKQRVVTTQLEMEGASNGALWGAIVTSLALRLDKATGFRETKPLVKLNLTKPGFLKKFEETKFSKWLDRAEAKNGNKVMAGLAGVYTVLEGIVYFSNRSEHKKACAELRQLGEGKEIIRLPDGAEINLPKDAETVRKILAEEASQKQPTPHSQIQTGKEAQVESPVQQASQQKTV